MTDTNMIQEALRRHWRRLLLATLGATMAIGGVLKLHEGYVSGYTPNENLKILATVAGVVIFLVSMIGPGRNGVEE